MESLFPMPQILPSGFTYYDEFLTVEEERLLLDFILTLELHPFQFQGYEAKRKVVSYGYDYSFDHRKLTKGNAVPPEFEWLIRKVADAAGVSKKDDIAELLVTEYPPGAVINWHRDAPPFDVIMGVSLLSDCSFRLRPHEKQKQGRKNIITINVKRRSLYIISGEARSDWQHSIAPVSSVRYSLTLRTLRK